MQADVLHSHMMALAMFGAAATMGSAVPHVITMHGTGHETSAARRRWMLRGAMRASAASVSVSEGLKRELHGLIGSVADRMLILPNGVPEREGARDRTRAALGVVNERNTRRCGWQPVSQQGTRGLARRARARFDGVAMAPGDCWPA